MTGHSFFTLTLTSECGSSIRLEGVARATVTNDKTYRTILTGVKFVTEARPCIVLELLATMEDPTGPAGNVSTEGCPSISMKEWFDKIV